MFSHDRNTHELFGLLACLVICFTLQFPIKNRAFGQVLITSPSRADFATCKLTTEEKEKFLNEHNKFRGMVNPPAADMEYLIWDDNLANMAQMWSNKCIWGHGFVQFNEHYPYSVTFKGQLGQNLAREVGKLPNPEDRVERWYNETYRYTFSQFASPMGPAACTREPCGHYTQLVWAKSKYVGCAVNWCSNFFSEYGGQGGTFVACDYAPTGNMLGQYPYQRGTPCTKCASGKGFCYKNLCRDCLDYDKDCGTGFSKSMCTSHPELMERMCPKMCNLCKCPLKCQNGGALNLQNCVCSCPSGWRGMDCSAKECPPGYYGENCENRCYDRVGKETCEWRKINGHDCKAVYMKIDCAATCGYCDDGSKTTTTVAPVTAALTPPPVTIVPTAAPPPALVNYPTPAVPQVCSADLNSGCEAWAAVGECEKNVLWMIPNCCFSCKYHKAPKDCIDSSPSCPLWAYNGECDENRVWMSENCRKSCNVCGDCKDTDAKCPSWALLGQCNSGNRITWMNTNCRKSCGLCEVYDRHNECPAWSAMGECKKSNWTWMVDHCPRSCDVPFAEASFCGGKANGNYQAPTTCQAYIACSNCVTSHVACPDGEKYDAVKRVCEPADRAICKVLIPRKTSNSWKMIATLKKSIV